MVPFDQTFHPLHKLYFLQTLKTQRFEAFTELKAEILDLYEQLECEPNTSFERKVVCEEDEAFVLSSVNLNLVEAMRATLRYDLILLGTNLRHFSLNMNVSSNSLLSIRL